MPKLSVLVIRCANRLLLSFIPLLFLSVFCAYIFFVRGEGCKRFFSLVIFLVVDIC